MLDSVQEPSKYLSRNLLLLPRILKLMKQMVDDSTPLILQRKARLLNSLPKTLIVYEYVYAPISVYVPNYYIHQTNCPFRI